MHAKNAADALFPFGDRIVHIRPGLQCSRIHPEVRQFPDKRISHNLEGERCEFLLVADFALDVICHVHVMTRDLPSFRSRGEGR